MPAEFSAKITTCNNNILNNNMLHANVAHIFLLVKMHFLPINLQTKHVCLHTDFDDTFLNISFIDIF